MRDDYIEISIDNRVDPKRVAWEDFLDTVNDKAHYFGIELVGESGSVLRAECDPGTYEVGEPIITFSPLLDSDGETNYTYYMPIVELPVFDSSAMKYYDDLGHYMQKYAENLGEFAKLMAQTPFREDYDDNYYSEEE